MNLIALFVSMLGKSNYDFWNGILSCEPWKWEYQCTATSCIVYFHLSSFKDCNIGSSIQCNIWISFNTPIGSLRETASELTGIDHNEELTQNTSFTYKIFIILNPKHVAKPLQHRLVSPLNYAPTLMRKNECLWMGTYRHMMPQVYINCCIMSIRNLIIMQVDTASR